MGYSTSLEPLSVPSERNSSWGGALGCQLITYYSLTIIGGLQVPTGLPFLATLHILKNGSLFSTKRCPCLFLLITKACPQFKCINYKKLLPKVIYSAKQFCKQIQFKKQQVYKYHLIALIFMSDCILKTKRQNDFFIFLKSPNFWLPSSISSCFHNLPLASGRGFMIFSVLCEPG